MAWHYLYDTATGKLVTEVANDDVLPSPVPDGLAVVSRESRWQPDEGWDPATRMFIAYPSQATLNRDLAQETADEAGALSVPLVSQDSVKQAAINVLVGRRYESASG